MAKVKKRLIIDGSSICWYALLAGNDTEFNQKVEVDGRVVNVNGWQYGFENAMNSISTAWKNLGIQPKDTIFVWESGNTKGYRKQFLPDYKGGRDSGRPPEAYDQFNLLKEALINMINSLGGTAVTRQHMEGDDIIAYLVRQLRGEKIVMSQDGDLAVLLDREDTKIWKSATLVTENPYGPFVPKLIPVYKALVGDSSDKIPGAPGFGPTAFLNMLAMFDESGLLEVENMIKEGRLLELEDNIADLKAIKKIVDNRDTVTNSYRAAILYPELIESMRVPLEWRPGYVKQRSEIQFPEIAQYAGVTRAVTAETYDTAYNWARKLIAESDSVSLDIETSTPAESDAWLAAITGKGDEEGTSRGVDVLGSELNGLSLTFGPNDQYTVYLTVGHLETPGKSNLTVDQVRKFVELIPKTTPIAVHNCAFELPVLYQTWGEAWKSDETWRGFLPNVRDTQIMSNYVDENFSSGLKKLSKRWFDYEQQTYAEVTGGRKMNELTLDEVLAYGADDTIMTAGLYNFFNIFMECEETITAYEEVEIFPAYLTAHAFVKGFKYSHEHLLNISREDDEKYEKLSKILDEYLISKGWEGTVCPVYTVDDLAVPAKIKEIVSLVTRGEVELKTMVRTPSKLYTLVGQLDHPAAETLERMMLSMDIKSINQWVAEKFDGKPQLDLSSARQMQNLLYRTMGLRPRLVNALTDNERANKPELAKAVYGFNKWYRGSAKAVEPTPEQWELLKTKATTDRFAVEFALAFDGVDRPELVPVLRAIQDMAKIVTRRSLFYASYPKMVHWKTGRIHPNLNQCATVTRRYSSSRINVQQMSKKGEGVKLRGVMKPHVPGGWIASCDFDGQELRLGADQSRDPAMLGCFIGDNLRDIHSIMASHPNMLRRWQEDLPRLATKYGLNLETALSDDFYRFFDTIRHGDDEADKKMADDLRKLAKNVVFGTQYDAQAPTLAKNMTTLVSEAQEMLEAKQAMFPQYDVWKDEVVEDLRRVGYVTTYLGARRHLAEGLLSTNKWEVAKAERQGPNMKIQGSAAEQTKLAMAKLWLSGVFFRYDAEFIAPIHDEVVFSVSDEDLIACSQEVHACMVTKYLKEVPSLSSLSFGRDFAKQHECGTHFDAEIVNRVRAKIVAAELAAA